MYELAELTRSGKDLYFISARGGPSGHLELLDERTLRLQLVGANAVDLTLCSKDIDR